MEKLKDEEIISLSKTIGAKKPAESEAPKGFVRFTCRKCGNHLDVKEDLLNRVFDSFPFGWRCGYCGHRNKW